MDAARNFVPIYTSRGDLGGYLVSLYIYNPQGEWIGWTDSDRTVYAVNGIRIGWLTKEPRILRKRSESFHHFRQNPPPPPPDFYPPASVPLAPLMAELPFGTIDVLDEEPELMPCFGFDVLSEEID
jgi:hypothetical protein